MGSFDALVLYVDYLLQMKRVKLWGNFDPPNMSTISVIADDGFSRNCATLTMMRCGRP